MTNYSSNSLSTLLAMSSLARENAASHLHTIDLPYRFSSWALDDPHGDTKTVIVTYKIDNLKYHILSRIYIPSNLRVHILDDAQRALSEGDFQLAINLYNRAAYDDRLLNVDAIYAINSGIKDYPNEYQRAFALFRLAVIHSYLKNLYSLRDIVIELEQSYPPNKPGGEFTVLARILNTHFDTAKTMVEICNDISDIVKNDYPDLPLHIGFWGISIDVIGKSYCPL